MYWFCFNLFIFILNFGFFSFNFFLNFKCFFNFHGTNRVRILQENFEKTPFYIFCGNLFQINFPVFCLRINIKNYQNNFWSQKLESKPLNAANILSHVTNSLIMLLDIIIVSYPMKLYHVVQPIAFGICYGIFSYIYYACGGKDM